MLTPPFLRFKAGRRPCDPPTRLWGPILLWQLLGWPVAALGETIRRPGATRGNRGLSARAGGSTRASQAGKQAQRVARVSWWQRLLERVALAVIAVGGALVAVQIVRALAGAGT